MRGFVLITFLIIHSTTATLDIHDIHHLKDNAALKLQIITDTASSKLHELTETASEQIQKLTETAASSVQKLAENIDLQKLQEYDFLHILPKIQKGQKFIESYKDSIPAYIPPQGEKLRYYYQKLHSISAKDVADAIELPWPLLRK